MVYLLGKDATASTENFGSTMFKERRQFSRIKLNIPLRYQIRGEAGCDNTISSDLCLEGIGFSSNNFIAPATNLMLEFKLLDFVLDPIGRVVWVSPIPHSNRYRLGVKFVELGLNKKNFLKEFINMQHGSL
jgi:hypothetical protein